MNFFARQDLARRRSQVQLAMLAICLITMVALVDVFVLYCAEIIFNVFTYDHFEASMGISDVWTSKHTFITTVVTSLVTLAIMAGASIYRTRSLDGGGVSVACSVGAMLIPANVTDPRRRRFRNVVEEMALASGLPVPMTFVMEDEGGVNAFVAGHSPMDAAVVVTRGLLDRLDREELQGVVAHEFSHILNGDMLLNTRLIGLLYGFLAIDKAGRLFSDIHRKQLAIRGSKRKESGLPAGPVGLALIAIGSVGVFLGRLIKAAISRQREYLADASAVQFTRQTHGIAGALKKIAVLDEGSRLYAAGTEEICHMLFATGLKAVAGPLATHPPIFKRIRAIEPRFTPYDLLEIRLQMDRHATVGTVAEADDAHNATASAGLPAAATEDLAERSISLETLVNTVHANADTPSAQAVAFAIELIDGIPGALHEAVHDQELVGSVMLAMIAADDGVQDPQALLLRVLSADVAQVATQWLALLRHVEPARRMALVELALPALRNWDKPALTQLTRYTVEVIQLIGDISPFQYALTRVLLTHVRDLFGTARVAGTRKLAELRQEATDLLSIFTKWGHGDPVAAMQACDRGLSILFPMDRPVYRPPEHWVRALNQALDGLDDTNAIIKQALVDALLSAMQTRDGRVNLRQVELLRAICSSLHVPVPLVGSPDVVTRCEKM